MPTATQVLGLVMWALLFAATFIIRRWSTRKLEQVSRNAAVGTKWEQDEPYPECFEEDDLDGA